MLLFRSFVSVLLSFSIVVTSVAPSYSQQAFRPEKVSCSVSSDADFRDSLEKIVRNVMGDSLEGIKYASIVDTSWKNYNVDKTIDRLVDSEVKRLREEKSILELVSTLASSEAREELARELAEGVYGSEDFKKIVENVANDVGLVITKRLDKISSKAENPVSNCISKYIGPQYGDTIALYVAQQTRQRMSVDPDDAKSETGVTDIISASAGGIAGGLLVVLRRAIVRRLTQWIGKRLVGTVIARVVGAAAGIIGWILIAKEIWDLRLGVLPIIASEMKAKKTKRSVKEELTKGLDIELSNALNAIPKEIAGGIFQVWTDFKEKNAQVLALAKKHPEFKVMLKSLQDDDEEVSLSRLRKTNELVNLALKTGDEAHFLKLLRDGTLKKAILELTEDGVRIAIEAQSIEAGYKWSKIAKGDLKRILILGLHTNSKPEDYSQKKIRKLLALNDDLAIKRFSLLQPGERNTLFSLPDRQFRDFLETLTQEQLQVLSGYIAELSPDAARVFVEGIRSSPDKMRLFGRSEVRFGVVRSKDQLAAVNLMLRQSSGWEFMQLPNDVRLAANGDVSPVLLWSKQPLAVSVASIFLIILLLAFYRLIFGRRKQIIVVNNK